MGRLILGFDAGCMTCSELAGRIEEVAGDKLEVISLHDPRMQRWREDALGEDATWAPTLVEIKDGEAKAWTGVRMGAHLSRTLGPMATWKIMQVLGDIGAAHRTDESAAARAFGRMSRGQFLKGVGGAVVGMSVLSGVGSLATPAAAQEQAPQSVGFKEFKGGRLRNAVREAAEYADIQNVAPDDVAKIANYDVTDAKAGIHTLENGNKMLVVAVALSENRGLVYYETRRTPVKRGSVEKSRERPVKRGRVSKAVETEAMVHRLEGGDAVLEGMPSHNGALDIPVPQSEGGFTTQVYCPGCTGAPGARYLDQHCRTASVAQCILASGVCGYCAGACFPLIASYIFSPACYTCVSVSCAYIFPACCGRRQPGCVRCGNVTL